MVPQLDIRHLRLRNQHLLTPLLQDPAEVLRSLVAVQAQDFQGAKWSVSQRTSDCTETQMESAFNQGRILRIHVMRPTWHFVLPADIRWLVELTAPVVINAYRYYYRKSELDEPLFKRANKTFSRVLRDGQCLTRGELRERLTRAGIEPGDSVRLGHIMHRAELEGLVCSGPRKGNQFTYALLEERAPKAKTLERDEALCELSRRYFESRGPATVQDFSWWSGLPASQAKRGLAMASDRLHSETSGGRTYWWSASATLSRGTIRRTVHLLPPFDEYLIAYKDRSAAWPPSFNERTDVSASVFDSPLILDGQVIGSWRRENRSDELLLKIKTFMPAGPKERALIRRETRRYASYIGRNVSVEWSLA